MTTLAERVARLPWPELQAELDARGYHRTAMRHGVSTLIRGRRTTLGVIFHDAR